MNGNVSGESDYYDKSYNLGNQYYYGIGVEKDLKEALRYYKLSSDVDGNSSSQLLLGLMYLDAVGGIHDKKEGMRLLLLSSKQGNILAKVCYYFNNYYPREGEIIEVKDETELKESLSQLRELSDKGNSSATNLIGYCYDIGLRKIDLDRNLKESFRHYKLSADQGNPSAQCSVGKCYHNGYGVDINLKEAFRYYKLSAGQGNYDGQCQVGYCCEMGIGVDIDLKEAFKYYKLSADRGDATAQNNIGYCYEKGIGVDIDLKEAFKYYKLSSDQGDAFAQAHLGHCYDVGKGDFNLKEAFKYYKLAADQYDVDSNFDTRYLVGICYHFGKGVDIDLNEAIRYYSLSIDKNKKKLPIKTIILLNASELCKIHNDKIPKFSRLFDVISAQEVEVSVCNASNVIKKPNPNCS